ncbi:MAG: hypothetical protein ACREQB_07610 [Candidatus Binataceae bacterium]
MRRLILLVSLGVFASLPIGAESSFAAGFDNGSVTGSIACVGNGSAMVDMKGTTVPVPTSALIRLSSDGNGNFTSGTFTGNTAGMVCSYTLASGSTYSVKPDGSGTATINWKGGASNAKQCPAGSAAPSSFVLYSQTSGFVVATGKDATVWSVCERQRP